MAPVSLRRKQLDKELLDAAAAGRHRDVERLVKEHANIEAVDLSGYTPVSEAAMAGHAVVVGQLLRELADPNRPADDGRTALHRASFQGWLPVVRLLLEKGADPGVKDARGQQPADLTRLGTVKEALLGAPAEQTRAALEHRKQQLALRPPPPPESEGEEEPDKPGTALVAEGTAAEATAAEPPAGGLQFSPPPRDGATQALTKAQGERERERKYQQALAELRSETDESGEAPGYCLAGPQLTARVQVLGCGEERLNGTYRVSFATKDRVEFEKVGDRKCQLFWTQSQDEWSMLAGDVKLGNTLYRHKHRPNVKVDECHGVPRSGWQKWFGKEPAPTVSYLPSGEPGDEGSEGAAAPHPFDEAGAGAGGAPPEAPEERPRPPAAGHGEAKFIELHPHLEIVAPAREGTPELGAQGLRQPAGGGIQVSLSGGGGLVETADGLFGVEELSGEGAPATAAPATHDERAAAWLDSAGSGPGVPATWEAIQAAKAAAQDLFAEGKVGDARQATTAAIKALQQLAGGMQDPPLCDTPTGADDGSHGGHLPSGAEVEELLGVLYSNRSLLLLQQIQAGDSEVLAFGSEEAWRLVAKDADAALRASSSNFKASFRRARALFELGELEDALTDATLVVDYYSRTSATPNPEAAALRDRILEAIRKERRKWGEKGQNPRWNRATHDNLITELGDGAGEPAAGGRAWPVDPAGGKAQRGHQPSAAIAQRLASAAPRPPPAPKTGGDVEKALLSTLKGDRARQLGYVREHLTVAALQRFYRRAPLGPDLLAGLVRLLGDLAGEDAELAGEMLRAIALTPSAKTHAAMFDGAERAALELALGRVGPEAAAAWEPAESP